MDRRIKQIGIPFILMIIFNLGLFFLTKGLDFNEGLSPHVGLPLISALLFGPYGAVGAVAANLICDLIRGFPPKLAILSEIVTIAVSILGYKLWYTKFKTREEITFPSLNNTTNVILFVGITIFCGIIYTILHGKIFDIIYPQQIASNYLIEFRYFLNFTNSAFIFGIFGTWLSRKIDYVYVPKRSTKKFNKKLYQILASLLIISLILTLILDLYIKPNHNIFLIEFAIPTLILCLYTTKPITSKIYMNNYKSISLKIMNIFQLTILLIILMGILLSYNPLLLDIADALLPINEYQIITYMMILMDLLLLIFFIPSVFVLKYIEMKVIGPILSFSKIERFIHKNEKIEYDRLADIYSKYINEATEIGTLARSYTDLINYNNNYIENIKKIKGEQERIEAELDIARNIQASNLPTEALIDDNFIIDGYSHPAKEVGGDFFDYYMIDDDNLAMVIGDASGKGVPAAILSLITQVIIKQILENEKDPSKVLNLINNQLCEKNSETMFITLWFGIYNKTSHKLIFSNAGHNPPLVKENDEFKYLDINSGIVLGIMEDFEYVKEEIELKDTLILYTDGITDENNKNDEIYGEERLLKFFNEYKENSNPIEPLLKNIRKFSKGQEQFDDMTLVYLKNKDD